MNEKVGEKETERDERHASMPRVRVPSVRALPSGEKSRSLVAAPKEKIQALVWPGKGKSSRPPGTLAFRLEDGVAVVQGDVVVGELVNDNGAETGLVKVPHLSLWPSNVIPFYIQPNLQDPERVLRALELFSGTAIQFIPATEQEDMMVFEEGTGVCKSYVGRVGGKQPLWIAPGCQPEDIAHEIMHALGFVHEQNRLDRDQFIRLFPENIETQYQDNFYRLPEELMKLSGLASFDFESLMMYPISMFSKNGQPTMESKIKGQEIRPGTVLSEKDRERINKVYGYKQ
ncbi:MAG: M12 family metallopeptidase [Pseudobdellovibrionaceae bacterium]